MFTHTRVHSHTTQVAQTSTREKQDVTAEGPEGASAQIRSPSASSSSPCQLVLGCGLDRTIRFRAAQQPASTQGRALFMSLFLAPYERVWGPQKGRTAPQWPGLARPRLPSVILGSLRGNGQRPQPLGRLSQLGSPGQELWEFRKQ